MMPLKAIPAIQYSRWSQNPWNIPFNGLANIRKAGSILLSLIVLYLLYQLPIDSLYIPISNDLPLLPLATPFPRGTDATKGHWMPAPNRAKTAKDWGAETCYDPSVILDEKGAPTNDDGARSRKVDSWEWLLDDGSRLQTFDAESVVIRALQSRIGFMLIGDSVVQEGFAAFMALLRMPENGAEHSAFMQSWGFGSVIQVNGPEKNPFFSNFTLTPNHPFRKRLESHPSLIHVPRSRFDEPIVRFWRSDNLMTSEAIFQVFKHLQREWNRRYEHEMKVDLRAWYRILSPWKDALQDYSNAKGWEGELPALLFLGSGPHWEPNRFPLIAEEKQVLGQKLVAEVYAAMSNLVSDWLLGMKHLPIRALYRSTYASHEYCAKYEDPISPEHPAALDPTGTRHETYNWHTWPTLNKIARQHFSDRRVLEDGSDVQVEYFDLWRMSATRPDAHKGWRGKFIDCLHWCPAGIPQWTIRAWWHTVVAEGW